MQSLNAGRVQSSLKHAVCVFSLLQAVWGESLLHNPLSRAMLNVSNTATLYLASVVLTLAIIINLLGW